MTWLAAPAVGFVALLVYLATLNPTLPPGDSGDLITAASTLGIAHPPGYPLFAMLGHLFTMLPFRSPAYRVNLMSAVLDATAIGLAANLIVRIAASAQRGVSRDTSLLMFAGLSGVVGALYLAFATEFWSFSLVAEVFALNNVFAVALLTLALTWYWNPDRRWVLRALFLASGLAFCNQQTIVLLAPALAAALAGGILRIRRRKRDWIGLVAREFVIGAGLVVVGLLPYLYLPIAAAGHPPALWGDPSTLERFVAVVTRADYGSFSLLSGGRHGDAAKNLAALAENLRDSFGWAGIALAACGAWWLGRRQPWAGAAILLAFLTTGPVFLAFAAPPLGGLLSGVFARFYILPSVPLALMVGCGAYQVLGWLRSLLMMPMTREPALRNAGMALAGALLVAAPVAPSITRYTALDQSSNYMTINFVRDLLAPLEPGAVLLTEGDTAVLGTWYAQDVEGYRADVVVVAVPLLRFQWYIDQFRRQHPDIPIPFNAADVATSPVTDRVVNANFGSRPIYYVGVIDEAFPAGFGEVRTGFARKFVRLAEASDPFSFVKANLQMLSAYHFPAHGYPVTSWENWESAYYGGAAFDLANAYEASDPGTAERWYRRAMALGPSLAASYKNLAILLSQHGGSPLEEADLLERYLALAPGDPEAPKIRATISSLRGSTP